jgi:hypothetical protein
MSTPDQKSPHRAKDGVKANDKDRLVSAIQAEDDE